MMNQLQSDCNFVFFSQRNFWNYKNMVEIASDTNLGFSLQIAAFSTTNRGFLWITIDVFFGKRCQYTLIGEKKTNVRAHALFLRSPMAPPLLKAFNTSRGILCLAWHEKRTEEDTMCMAGVGATTNGETLAHMYSYVFFVHLTLWPKISWDMAPLASFLSS